MTTPMRRQYLSLKRTHPDAILLFRLGDFYETFDEDARLVSDLCDIVLTSRPVAKGQRVPMAGVPHHAADGYIAKLIAAGRKVAIAEQVSSRGEGGLSGSGSKGGAGPSDRGLMERRVVRVITPGTVIEPEMLDSGRSHYLAAVATDGVGAGVGYVETTTGEFAVTQFEGGGALRRAKEEIGRLAPAECLLPETLDDGSEWVEVAAVTPYAAWRFEPERARQVLLDQFAVASLEGFGCEGLPLAVGAAGALVQYLSDTQSSGLALLEGLRTYSTADFMTLDSATQRNLELAENLLDGSKDGSLLGLLDLTVTPMGARLLRGWVTRPLLDVTRIERRLDRVEALSESRGLREEMFARLRPVGDLERTAARAAQGRASPRELLAIAEGLEAVPAIRTLASEEEISSSALDELSGELDPSDRCVELIRRAIADEAPPKLGEGRVIAPGYSPELDDLVATAAEARSWVAGLEARERERTDIGSLKVGFNRVFGYYLEVTNPNLHLVPPDYRRRQTLTHSERFTTPELKEHEALILNAEREIGRLEADIFSRVRSEVAKHVPGILSTSRALAKLDVHTALAEVATRQGYARPRLDETRETDLVDGRHPVVEVMQTDEVFVPNDTSLGPDRQIVILTGPNMAGKSTYLRQVALIVLMAQIGSFVPAREARIGLVDRIFTRTGARDEIGAGRSTFLVEMLETARMLRHATSGSLLVFDEIGRGTSTYDGISIAWAVVEHLHRDPEEGPRTLFATHYHELTGLEGLLPRVKNYNVAVSEEAGRVVFLRRIEPGPADRSYGIHVARMAGLPRGIVERAWEVLAEMEGDRTGTSPRAGGPPPSSLPGGQLLLFGEKDLTLLTDLRDLELDDLSPLEAINLLAEWQRKLNEGGDPAQPRPSS